MCRNNFFHKNIGESGGAALSLLQREKMNWEYPESLRVLKRKAVGLHDISKVLFPGIGKIGQIKVK